MLFPTLFRHKGKYKGYQYITFPSQIHKCKHNISDEENVREIPRSDSQKRSKNRNFVIESDFRVIF